MSKSIHFEDEMKCRYCFHAEPLFIWVKFLNFDKEGNRIKWYKFWTATHIICPQCGKLLDFDEDLTYE